MSDDFEQSFNKPTKIYQVYRVLKDQQWHCRECEYVHVGTTQIAGGSGIQGLQRGTKSRRGLIIDSGNHLCGDCEKTTRHDRWTGSYQSSVQAPSMSRSFVRRVIAVLGGRDVVEGTERPPNQLTIDHKIPMLRWDRETQTKLSSYTSMSDADIRANFQLLKRSNGSVSHNLLKSRACERCFKTRQRGQPFGIAFFYDGNAKWQPDDPKDVSGCTGCGWYDFDLWRRRLNDELNDRTGINE